MVLMISCRRSGGPQRVVHSVSIRHSGFVTKVGIPSTHGQCGSWKVGTSGNNGLCSILLS